MFQTIRTVSIFLFSFVLLQGCFLVNGPLEYADANYTDETNAPSVNYLPIGIPFLLGGHGSSVPITAELSLTAKHIAQLDYSSVVAYHPDCDIAIIKEDNTGKNVAPLGTIQTNEATTTVGMGLTGKVLIGQGKYYIDVNFVDSSLFATCPASITDAPVQSGMSGGGVFNEEGQLVGIISGISGSGFKLLDGTDLGNERTSVFVSTLHVKPWLEEAIATYYGAPREMLTANLNVASEPDTSLESLTPQASGTSRTK
ncbi:serine protease [Enterovibrio sp. ZSDZ42]|uniref:Serine protease n=1 Tax=Enterovibrio gelatinilyticus TaxID=2899819 RepID=A0ABT5R6Y1_9GAMM|nr:trypsin-like peptidase domain-containing protein [Enterovibrio sp. ZSDZ42]MDD1796023.1 serine protease [Enterovibrio sp. ZSDZ42]